MDTIPTIISAWMSHDLAKKSNRKPASFGGEFAKRKSKVLFAVASFFMYLIVIGGFLFLIRWLDSFMELPPNPVNTFKSDNKWRMFLIVVLAAPVFEELAFRLHLSFSKANFFISLWLIIGFTVVGVTGYNMISWNALSILVVSAICFGLLYHRISDRLVLLIQKFHQYALLGIIVITSLVFSYMHYYHVDFTAGNNYYLLLMLLPQFVFGLIVSFVRIKSGFKYAIAFHSIHNLLIFLPVLLTR